MVFGKLGEWLGFPASAAAPRIRPNHDANKFRALETLRFGPSRYRHRSDCKAMSQARGVNRQPMQPTYTDRPEENIKTKNGFNNQHEFANTS